MGTSTLICFCTCPDHDTARDIAHKLVAAGAAACVNITQPVTSVFNWEGKTEEDTEVLFLAKTTREAYPALERLITEAHPYDCPEIIAAPIEAGIRDYLDWVATETQDAG